MMLSEWNPSTKQDVIQALMSDNRFSFKQVKDDLHGTCPSCNKKEAYISIKSPGRVTCRREKKCQYSETTRNLYPDIFENFSKRHPVTEADPDATAKACLAEKRGFPVQKIKGWFSQGQVLISKNNKHSKKTNYKGPDYWAPTVRFYMYGGTEQFWERLIDASAVKDFGAKANFKSGGGYTGKHWEPPGFKIEKGDTIKVVEGIFHCIALTLKGYKSVASFSCVNFPWELYEKHKNDDITWQHALDGDAAGTKYMAKHHKILMGDLQKSEVLLVPNGGKADWDDLFRLGRINDNYIKNCLYRGRLFTAENIEDKAYYWWEHTRKDFTILEFKNSLHRVDIDRKIKDTTEEEDEEGSKKELSPEQLRHAFNNNKSIDRISNFLPDFRYVRNDPEDAQKRLYCFKVHYGDSKQVELIELPGAAMDSATSFKRMILDTTNGGRFKGTNPDFNYLASQWLDYGVSFVKAVDVVGYDIGLAAYIFQGFAVKDGSFVEINDEGFFNFGETKIKTVTARPLIESEESYNLDWFNTFEKCFNHFGIVALAFFTASLFICQIKKVQGSFPFFEMTGEPGAGKTTLLKFLQMLIGRSHYEGLNIHVATPPARAREFSGTANLPVSLIESDGKDDKSFNFDDLKPLFDYEGITRLTAQKNRGNSTDTKKFRGTIVIAQNDRVEASPALMERIVHCNVTKDHHTPELEELAKYFQRVQPSEVSGYLVACLTREKQYLNAYYKAFDRQQEFFSNTDLKNQRIKLNFSKITATVEALGVLFPEVTPTKVNEIRSYLLERAKIREDLLGGDHPLVQQFWEQIEYFSEKLSRNKEQGYISIASPMNHAKEDSHIYIQLSEYTQLVRHYGQTQLPMTELKALLKQSKVRPFIKRGKVRSVVKKCTVDVWQFQKCEEDFKDDSPLYRALSI